MGCVPSRSNSPETSPGGAKTLENAVKTPENVQNGSLTNSRMPLSKTVQMFLTKVRGEVNKIKYSLDGSEENGPKFTLDVPNFDDIYQAASKLDTCDNPADR